MHPGLARRLYAGIQRCRREPVLDCLRELEQTQWHSAEDLLDLQWRRVTRLLSHAYHSVPFYRERFKAAGIAAEDIRSPSDLAGIPVLTKQQLRTQHGALLSSAGRGLVSRMTTSGSSGDPLTVIRDRRSTGYHRAAKYRGHLWYGIDIGDREARFWGVPVGWRGRARERAKDLLMNRIRASAYRLEPRALHQFYQRLVRFQPAYLFGYASLLDEFARFVLQERLDGRGLRLNAAISTSETLRDFQRRSIEGAFGCPTVNEFGCTETGIIAFECPAGGMHIPVEAVYVEIIPENLAGGQDIGRVIVTDLHNYAMPIIRYDVGDLAALSHRACPCGRGLPVLDSVTGRQSDVITTPDGKRIHTIIFYYILCGLESKAGAITRFQVIRHGDNRYLMKLVPDAGFRHEELAPIRQKIDEYLGPTVDMRYEIVDHIDRSPSGKQVDYVDLTTRERLGDH